VFIEVLEEGCNFGEEVGGLVFECEEGASNWFQSVGLNDGPFFDDFGVLLVIEEET